ncbi:MAG: FtsX-like permease family protein [Bacteroidota bacterium]
MKKKGLYQPPQLALKLFRWYCRPDRLEELEGDLEEFFFLRKDQGAPLWKARLFFWWNVLRCYKTYSKSKTQNSMTFYPLFKSYFKLAMRHSWKNKWAVLINIAGLGVALSMCIFVYSLYAHNFEFDSFYENTDDVYRINSMTFENGQERRNEISPSPIEYTLRNDMSSVQQVSSYFDEYMSVKIGNDFFEQSIGIASSDFFEMFEMPLWYGSFSGFGEKPMIFLTKSTSKRYFGNEVALGKRLTLFITSTKKIEVEVGGVFERIPLNSSFGFNGIICLNDYLKGSNINMNDWKRRLYMSHYVRTEAANTNSIESRLNDYLPQQNEAHESLKMTRFELIPFKSPLHNDADMYRNNTNIRLGIEIYIIFTSLAFMIFLIACFNLANSSIAMIASRLKEIGIRKTLGSENKQILIQFLIEMGVVCLLSFIVALSMINFISNSIMGLFGETFMLQDISLKGVIFFIIGFLLFTTLCAGIMPALYAWKFQPIAIMRRSVKLRGVGWINKALTIAQYSFSIAVLSAAVSFASNEEFLDTLDLGYANDSIYTLELNDKELYPSIKQKIDQIPGVETVGTFSHLQKFGRSSRPGTVKIDTSSYQIRTYTTGTGYINFMELPITLGRTFVDGSSADQERSMIVNQEFVNQYFSGKNPINSEVEIAGERKVIIGVCSNIIHDVYADSEDEPSAFLYKETDKYPYLIAKVNIGDKAEIEKQFKTIWSEEVDRPYQGSWQKDLAYGSAVRDTTNLRIIFMAMAILGGFLSTAGIFSLSKLNVAKRKKEISVRKVLGSSLRQLLLIINKPFFIVLSISILFGCALGYIISDMVLGMVYRYYVDISPTTSLFSGLFIAFVAFAIIIASIWGAAKANPVVGLREE